MAFSYDDFKKFAQNREFNDFRQYLSVINHLINYYNEEEFKFFYPKNLFNDKHLELFFFIAGGYFVVTVDDQIMIKHFNCKVVNKTLILPQYNYGEQELRVYFDNGNSIILNNIQDSNENWESEYSDSIKELYKLI